MPLGRVDIKFLEKQATERGVEVTRLPLDMGVEGLLTEWLAPRSAWCNDNCADLYAYSYDPLSEVNSGFWISFLDPNDALNFKLVWM